LLEMTSKWETTFFNNSILRGDCDARTIRFDAVFKNAIK